MSGETALDPNVESRSVGGLKLLRRLNPLAKLGAVLPAMALVALSRDWATPAAFVAFGLVLLLIGGPLPGRILLALLVGVPALMLALSLSFGVWVDPARVPAGRDLVHLGDYAFTTSMWASGAATGLRLGAVMVLGLMPGLTSTGPEIVRATVQNLRVPYRVGYAALAAFRFVPRLRHDLDVIRAAHRIRGMAGGRGPLAALRRWLGYVVPLLAGAIRHAERLAVAMDARAFGAHPTRTERHEVPFRARDWLFIGLYWAASAALLILIPRANL